MNPHEIATIIGRRLIVNRMYGDYLLLSNDRYVAGLSKVDGRWKATACLQEASPNDSELIELCSLLDEKGLSFHGGGLGEPLGVST